MNSHTDRTEDPWGKKQNHSCPMVGTHTNIHPGNSKGSYSVS